MLYKLLFISLFLSLSASADTLTLISGNGQLVQTGSGLGSSPIILQLTNGSVPVPNVVVTFKNGNGSYDDGLTDSVLTTNSSGIVSAQFVPSGNSGDFLTYALEASAPGSNVVTFYETAASLPQTQLTLLKSPVNPPQYPPYTVSAGQPGAPVEISVFGGGGVANVSLSLVPITSTTAPPPGTLVQSISCQVNGALVPQVLTDATGDATCVPVFKYPNVGLLSQYNGGYTFKVVIGGGNFFGPYSYQINPLPVSISAGPEKLLVAAGSPVNATITAINGVPPYSFAFEASGGPLPAGVTLSTNGILTGTPTTPGLYPFLVQVTDSKGNIATSSALGLSLAVSGGPITITPTTLPPGIVGKPYSQTISISGGVPPYKPGITGLPGTLKGALTDTVGDSFSITGTPTAPGTFTLSLAVLDAINEPGQASFVLGITTPLTFGTSTVPIAVVGASYSLTLGVSGGLQPYSFAAAALPAGLTLSSTGIISGTVSATPGLYTVTLTLGDSGGEILTVPLVIPVSDGPLSYPAAVALPDAPAAGSYTAQIPNPTGGVPPYSFALAGTPPAGVTLTTAGVLTANFATTGVQSIPFTVTDAAAEAFTGTLQINVGTVPAIATIVNAGSFLQVTGTPTVAPGELISVFGVNLGPTAGTGATVSSTGTIATTLSGVQVTFGGTAAPLLYVAAGQINAVVPFEIPVGTTVPVTVTYNGTVSTVFSVSVLAQDPGIFLVGTTQGAILNSDASVNSATNPAIQGKYVQIYATGGQPFAPVLTDGSIVTTASTSNIPGVSVTIGGTQAQLLYAGAGPGLVAGVVEINVLVPTGLTAGPAVPVVLTINGQASTQVVTLAVAAP